MTKREARKIVLRFAAQSLRADIANGSPALFGAASTEDEECKVRLETERLADHLEWEADGRPKAFSPPRRA